MTKTETFAEQHRLKASRDECNDQIIQGRRGHLYFDGAELGLMVLDGKGIHPLKVESAGRQALARVTKPKASGT